MSDDDIEIRKQRLMSEFLGMCAAFNIDNCSMDDLTEELSRDSEKKEEKGKTIKKSYPN